jgi:hypothetical protein
MKVFLFMVAVGLVVALARAGLQMIAPPGWWG